MLPASGTVQVRHSTSILAILNDVRVILLTTVDGIVQVTRTTSCSVS